MRGCMKMNGNKEKNKDSNKRCVEKKNAIKKCEGNNLKKTKTSMLGWVDRRQFA